MLGGDATLESEGKSCKEM